MNVNVSYFLEISSRLDLPVQIVINAYFYYVQCDERGKLGNRKTLRKKKAWAAYSLVRQAKLESQVIQFERIILACEARYKDVWQLLKRDEISDLAFFYRPPSDLLPCYAGLLSLTQRQCIHVRYVVKQLECQTQNTSPETVIAYALSVCPAIEIRPRTICQVLNVSTTSVYRLRHARGLQERYKSAKKVVMCCTRMQAPREEKSSNSEESEVGLLGSSRYYRRPAKNFRVGVEKVSKFSPDDVLGGRLTPRGVRPGSPPPKKSRNHQDPDEGYESAGDLFDDDEDDLVGVADRPDVPENPQAEADKKNRPNLKTRLRQAYPKAFDLDPILGEKPKLPPNFKEEEIVDYSRPYEPDDDQFENPRYEDDLVENENGEKRVKGKQFRLLKEVRKA